MEMKNKDIAIHTFSNHNNSNLNNISHSNSSSIHNNITNRGCNFKMERNHNSRVSLNLLNLIIILLSEKTTKLQDKFNSLKKEERKTMVNL